MDLSQEALTIGDLSRRTGVPVGTLRSWELRHGFPVPARIEGGHRRYDTSDVDRVLAVLEDRRAGMSLGASVEHVLARPDRARSVYAELRRTYPSVVPQALTRRTLIALSRAIEDECCARAADPVLFGGFQHERHFDGSRARWRDLARTARSTVVFAEFASSRIVEPGTPSEVSLPPDSALGREWLVICDAQDLPACLAAIELPGQHAAPARVRRYETVWSVDPHVVRHASRVAAALADEFSTVWRGAGTPAHEHDVAGTASADLARASQLFDRMLGYLDAP